MDWRKAGDGVSSGTVGVDIASSFEARVRIRRAVVDRSGVRVDLVGLCGGEFDVLAAIGQDDFRFRIDGPPAFVSSDGSARFGTPVIGVAEARGRLKPGDLAIGYRGVNDVCENLVSSHNGELRREIAAALEDPDEELAEALRGFGVTINRTLTSPFLRTVLDSPWGTSGGRKGVVIFVDGEDLVVVHEKE